MATKTIRLDENVYEMLAERKHEDETFSEAVERLIDGRQLVELAGVYTEDEVQEIEQALDDKYERERQNRISETERR